jgi:hAT family C-terminal dimerisation region
MSKMTPIASQLDSYLSSKAKTIESLRDYPAVANAFMKANSTSPSSAVVERLFSAAGQILTSRRCSLSDEHFDWMVFVRDRLKNKSVD